MSSTFETDISTDSNVDLPTDTDTDDEDASQDLASTSRLPVEVLSLIAQHLTIKDLASCARASKAFFDIFGPVLYHHVAFKDIISSPAGDINEFHRRLIPRIKEVHADADLYQMDMPLIPTDRLSELTRLCHGLSVIKMVQWPDCCQCRNQPDCQCGEGSQMTGRMTLIRSDIPAEPSSGTHPHLTTTLPTRQAVRALMEFNLFKAQPGDLALGCLGIWHPAYAVMVDWPQLRTLTIVMSPIVRGGLLEPGAEWLPSVDPIYFTDMSSPNSVYSNETGHQDFCASLALICAQCTDETVIKIVNIEQLRVHIGVGEYHTIDPSVDILSSHCILSKTGSALYLCDDDAASSLTIASAHGESVSEAALRAIRTRMDTIKWVTRKWLERMLSETGRQEELDRRWSNIRFLSLKEYMDEPGWQDDWLEKPDADKWI